MEDYTPPDFLKQSLCNNCLIQHVPVVLISDQWVFEFEHPDLQRQSLYWLQTDGDGTGLNGSQYHLLGPKNYN